MDGTEVPYVSVYGCIPGHLFLELLGRLCAYREKAETVIINKQCNNTNIHKKCKTHLRLYTVKNELFELGLKS